MSFIEPSNKDEYPNLIDDIFEEMVEDEEDREEQSELLKQYYKQSSQTEKQRIDLCFIALCGFSLKTMVERQENK